MKKLSVMISMVFLLSLFPSIALGADSVMDVICAPSGIVMDDDGALLVTDTYGNVVWRIEGQSSEVYAVAEGVKGLYGEPAGGYYDGPADKALFQEPWAIAPYLDGYAVSDPGNQVVRLISASGVSTAVGSGTPGFLNGKGTKAMLDYPTGLAADEAGNLYIADTNNQSIRMVTRSGMVSTYAQGFTEPTGLCYKNGVLYVADSGSHQIFKVTGGNTETVAGSGAEGMADGIAALAQFSAPQGVAVDDEGVIYVSDTGNMAVRKIVQGQVSTVMEGGPEVHDFYPISPVGLLIQGDTLYICDNFSRMVLSEKIK